MRIACVQCDVAFADPRRNVETVVNTLEELGAEGTDLVVFPEAMLTGYCVDCLDDARRIAIPSTHASLGEVRDACERLGVMAILGYAELGEDGVVRNAAALLEPGEPTRTYYKSHLPELGLDKFVQRGEELPVFDTRLGKIGILICFDLRPPEPMRVLALKGAELVVLPTNWPVGAEVSAQHIAIARAAENRVFLATCDRVGEENGFRFIGLSKIIHPSGKVLAAAGDGEEVLRAELDLAEARTKRNVGIPGKYETTVFECRNPSLYGGLVEPVT